jgi:hypothetical protein
MHLDTLGHTRHTWGVIGCISSALGHTCWVHWAQFHTTLDVDINGQVRAPLSIVKVVNVGTWVHLGLKGLASSR